MTCRPSRPISTTSSSSTCAPSGRGPWPQAFTPEALARTYGGRLAATHTRPACADRGLIRPIRPFLGRAHAAGGYKRPRGDDRRGAAGLCRRGTAGTFLFLRNGARWSRTRWRMPDPARGRGLGVSCSWWRLAARGTAWAGPADRIRRFRPSRVFGWWNGSRAATRLAENAGHRRRWCRSFFRRGGRAC